MKWHVLKFYFHLFVKRYDNKMDDVRTFVVYLLIMTLTKKNGRKGVKMSNIERER